MDVNNSSSGKYAVFHRKCFIIIVFVAIIEISILVGIDDLKSDISFSLRKKLNLPQTPDDNVQEKELYPSLRSNNSLPEIIDTSNAFNQTNPYESSYCPDATCFNSPICTPCNQRYLFILATGRSGSTSLLKMFNQLPNVRLSGENYNILYEASKISTFFDKNENKPHFHHKETREKGIFMHEPVREGPFQHNGMPVGSMACISQTLFRTINPPDFMKTMSSYHPSQDEDNIIGAKLIRIPNGEWTPSQTVHFFTNNFPCARFVINIRSNEKKQLDSVSSSFANDKADDCNDKSLNVKRKEYLVEQTEFLKTFHSLMGDEASRLIDMSEWKNDVSIINDVVQWLGFEQCTFDNIVHENHDGYERDQSTKIDLGANCKLSVQ